MNTTALHTAVAIISTGARHRAARRRVVAQILRHRGGRCPTCGR